jgi:hypothetical protein
VSEIEQFWRKIHDESGVKNCKLFEELATSSCNLARRVMNPKIACGANKIRLFTSLSYVELSFSAILHGKIRFARKMSNRLYFSKS